MYHPINSKGWVVFVHDINSSRKNHFDLKIAKKLKKSSFSVLMFDLITENEGKENSGSEKIILFKERLKLITNWLIHTSEWNHLPIGYYGSGYGAAIALDVKISTDFNISTIVCRDGHLEVVSHLENINCPVKLLVGSRYEKMISFNIINNSSL